MKISEIVDKLNGQETLESLAATLNLSRQTLSQRLKSVGYSFNKKTRKYEFTGTEDKNIVDERLLSGLPRNNTLKKSDKNHKKIIKKSDRIDEDIIDKSSEYLTEDEIKFIKKLHNTQSKMTLNVEFSMLPPKTEKGKYQMEISKETLDDFNEFAKKKAKETRFSKNDLVEMALIRFMREFQ